MIETRELQQFQAEQRRLDREFQEKIRAEDRDRDEKRRADDCKRDDEKRADDRDRDERRRKADRIWAIALIILAAFVGLAFDPVKTWLKRPIENGQPAAAQPSQPK
jgi:hypothetical protein